MGSPTDFPANDPLVASCPICGAVARSGCVWPGAESLLGAEPAPGVSWHLPRGQGIVAADPSVAPFTHGDWRIVADLPGQVRVQLMAQAADALVWDEFRRGGRHLDLLESEFAGRLALSGRGHRGTFTVRDQWSAPPFPACLTFRLRLPTTLRTRLGLIALRAASPDGSLGGDEGRLHPQVWTPVARWAAPNLCRLAVELDDVFESAKATVAAQRPPLIW